MKKRIVCFLVSVVFLFAGCQRGNEVGVRTENTEALETDESGKEEEIIIRVHDLLSSYARFDRGWMEKIFSDELGIKVEMLKSSQIEKADIIFYANETTFKRCVEEEQLLENGKLLEWSDELLEEHGSNIGKYLQESVNDVADICGGTAYGLKGNFGVEGLNTGMIFTISSTSEHPEEAMELINWMSDPDNRITMAYGPRGLCWDIDEDGYYYLTEFGLKCREDSMTEIPEEYGGRTLDYGYSNIIGNVWHLDAVNPKSKHGEGLNYETWKLMQDTKETVTEE